MSLQVSNNFKERILGSESFGDIFNGGRILVYSGPQPITADYPASGTLLAQITEGGLAWSPFGIAAGLNFEQANAFWTKDSEQAWRLVASAAGTAGWFRLVGPLPDDGLLSYNHPRVDGSIGPTSAAQFILASTALLVGTNMPIQQFSYTIPPILGA